MKGKFVKHFLHFFHFSFFLYLVVDALMAMAVVVILDVAIDETEKVIISGLYNNHRANLDINRE